jgi:DNA-binding CsgD family transcriptional regulator
VGRAVLHPFEFDGEQWLLVSYAPPRPAALAELTGSELSVVDLWLTGRSMRSIATERGVSRRTVANQIASAYQKLGVSSRAELLALVHDLAADGSCKPPRR